jgi:hypothetical protein
VVLDGYSVNSFRTYPSVVVQELILVSFLTVTDISRQNTKYESKSRKRRDSLQAL